MDKTYGSTYQEWAEAFLIFAKYEPDKTFVVVAEHDQVYTGHGLEVSQEDKNRLADLFWDYDKDLECWVKSV